MLKPIQTVPNPCKPDCPERSEKCHADCPKYAEFHEFTEASRERRYLVKDRYAMSELKEKQLLKKQRNDTKKSIGRI